MKLEVVLYKGCFARYGSDPDDFEYAMSEFLRMNGMYWGVACMDLMGRLEVLMFLSVFVFVIIGCSHP